MPKFKYSAKMPDGTVIKGVTEAGSERGARVALAERNLNDVSVKETKSLLQAEIGSKKVPKQEIIHLSRQMAAFVRAGVPLLDAIDVIAEESSNKKLQRALIDIAEGLRSGETLSEAVERHPDVFPKLYARTLRSAEMTGHLDSVLDQLARYLERDVEARRKIRSALTYPIVIFVLAVVTVVVLTAFVLPRFTTFFEELGAELPLATRILINTTEFLGDWWWAIVVGGVILAALFVYWSRTEGGRLVRDRFMLDAPIVGQIVRFAMVERFCRVLSSMVQAGVPLPDAMFVASEGANNKVFASALADVREAMIQGQGIARPIAASQLFPPTVTQMVRVGEDTGTLDAQLQTAANYYDQELDFKIKRLTSLFEPLVIVVMGLIVGFVAVALISAMYGIFNQATNVG